MLVYLKLNPGGWGERKEEKRKKKKHKNTALYPETTQGMHSAFFNLCTF